MLPSYTVNDIRAKSVVVKTTGYRRINVTAMLAVLADGSKLPLHVILIAKQCLRSSCLEESLSDANLNVI